jgi:hypothetical protein
MITLAEVETAVYRLALPEQEQLLRHLEELVRSRRIDSDPQERQQWMDRLDILRDSISTGRQTLTADEILAESREERS